MDEGLRVVDDVVDVDSDGESARPAKSPGFGAGPAPGLVRDGGSASGPLSPPDLNLGDRASRTAMLVGSSKPPEKRYALDQPGGDKHRPGRAGVTLKWASLDSRGPPGWAVRLYLARTASHGWDESFDYA